MGPHDCAKCHQIHAMHGDGGRPRPSVVPSKYLMIEARRLKALPWGIRRGQLEDLAREYGINIRTLYRYLAK